MNFIQLFALLLCCYAAICAANAAPTCSRFYFRDERKIEIAWVQAKNCTWTIDELFPEKVVVLRMRQIGLPLFRGDICEHASMRIFDEHGSEVEKFCDKTSEIVVLENGNFKVQFQTVLKSRLDRSYSVTWEYRDLAQCPPLIGDEDSGEVNLTISNGTVANCSWTITTKPEYYIYYVVMLTKNVTQERCGNLIRSKSTVSHDGLADEPVIEYDCIYDNTSVREHWTRGNELAIHLSKDAPGNFSLAWKAVLPCGEQTISEDGGMISVLGDQYMPNMDCSWKIKRNPGSYIHMAIDYDLEGVKATCFDNLQIWTEDEDEARKFCGKGSDVMRRSDDVSVRLKTDNNFQNKGFTITWKFSEKSRGNEIIKNPACGSKYVAGNPLCWKTSPTQQTTCFIKIKVNGRRNAFVMAHSLRLDNSKDLTSNKEVYGIRGEKINDNSFACLEFKCSGTLVDTNDADDVGTGITPYIQVFVRGKNSCRRTKVNKLLERYNRDYAAFPISDKKQRSNNKIFQMFSPRMEDPLGKSFGIFPIKRSCDESKQSPSAVVFKCK